MNRSQRPLRNVAVAVVFVAGLVAITATSEPPPPGIPWHAPEQVLQLKLDDAHPFHRLRVTVTTTLDAPSDERVAAIVDADAAVAVGWVSASMATPSSTGLGRPDTRVTSARPSAGDELVLRRPDGATRPVTLTLRIIGFAQELAPPFAGDEDHIALDVAAATPPSQAATSP
jgi:hypothetical protein